MYTNTKQQVDHREQLNNLRRMLMSAVSDAFIAFHQPLESNETIDDRAVNVKETLFDQAADALIAAWDGERSEFVEYLQMKLGVPLMGTLVDDGHGKYTIEWGKAGG